MRVEGTNDDRVKSKQLGCWLRVVGDHLRLATGEHGETIVPTAAERADAAERELQELRARLT